MKLTWALVVAATFAGAGFAASSAHATPPADTAAVTGQVTIAPEARLVSPLAINTQVAWQCSAGSVAILRVGVVQDSGLVLRTIGFARRVVLCDGAEHPTVVTVRALTGTFQPGEAAAMAALTVVGAPPATFSDHKTIRIS